MDEWQQFEFYHGMVVFFSELRMELVLTSAMQPKRDTTVPTLLDTFHVQGGPLDPNQESYYSNITGFIHGNAVFTNITLPALQNNHTLPWKHHAERLMKDVNTTGMGVRLGSWAWNTSTKLSLSVVEKHTLESQQPSHKTPLVTLIHVCLTLNLLSVVLDFFAQFQGRIELSDPSNSENLRLDFDGFHFTSSGSIFALAEPAG